MDFIPSYLASEGGLGAFPCSGEGDLSEGDLRYIGDVAATEQIENCFC